MKRKYGTIFNSQASCLFKDLFTFENSLDNESMNKVKI